MTINCLEKGIKTLKMSTFYTIWAVIGIYPKPVIRNWAHIHIRQWPSKRRVHTLERTMHKNVLISIGLISTGYAKEIEQNQF